MGVIVKRPVRVKVVVTEEFRTRRTAEMRTALAKLELVSRQLASRVQSLGGAAENPVAAGLLNQQNRNAQAHAMLREGLDKLAGSETGSEYDWGVLESTIEVEVGDSFSKLGACEIVVKDDKIIEIRDGVCPEPSEISS